jgi:hypothetical protein
MIGFELWVAFLLIYTVLGGIYYLYKRNKNL